MGSKGSYNIPFIGLKNGFHHFNYEITEEFFEPFESSQIRNCKVFVDLSFEKKDRLFILIFELSGSIQTECDRCGKEFNLPIFGRHQLYVKFGQPDLGIDTEEDVIWIDEGETILDLTTSIYEFIHLSLPLSKVHPDNDNGIPGCDPDVLKVLNRNEQEEKNIDPRWELLNKLNKE